MIVIKQYEGLNIKELQLLGCGTQGKVYKIDLQWCIKILKKQFLDSVKLSIPDIYNNWF